MDFKRMYIQSIIITFDFLVAAGNRGVPDDLQKCHEMSKQLQQNQTDIYQRLTVTDGRVTNLTLQVSLFLRFSLLVYSYRHLFFTNYANYMIAFIVPKTVEYS